MPTDQGLGPDDRDVLEHRWKPSIKLDQEQAIAVREVDTTAHLAPQYDKLMSECGVLCLKSALRLERLSEQGQEEAEQKRSSPLTLGDWSRNQYGRSSLWIDRSQPFCPTGYQWSKVLV